MLFTLYRIYVFSLVLVLIYNCRVKSFKIRYGREKSRIEKLKKRKGAILDKLNSYIKTRGYGLLPLKALPEDSDLLLLPEEEPETFLNPSVDNSLYLLTPEAVRRKKTKNPIIPVDFDKFNTLFRKISSLRTYKSNIDYENRPGKVDPGGYRVDFVETDLWDIHPSRLRVRGLYEYELKEPMKRHEFDTGSPEVVVAALTAKIDYLTHHLENNPKDVQAKRQITKLGFKRRRLLKYLFRTRRETYDLLTKTFDIHYDDDFCPLKKIIKKNTHRYHTKTKRYRSAKERKNDLPRKPDSILI
ncbi:ribosomal protein S15 [Theileria parva strain Muguga]|uniref:ribosomal protein S15 n=1 Tax=Theileria parva strain Muguga TaxID=333668 RepID=UPI001C619BBF|nr:ribosomal protein S15 [Theileria parva strain Muguga]EAN32002.2 ribosomal protein S15 [Theileria parva strain Muguga]